MKIKCSLCFGESNEDMKHLPLYLNGSEGIIICTECRIVLTEVAKAMRRVAVTAQNRERRWKRDETPKN